MTRMLEIATKLGADAFVVQRMTGREELGRLFEYHLELLSERADITPEQLLGSNATVALELADGMSQRYFNGYITRVVIQGEVRTTAYKSNTGYLYLVTMNPGLWFMGHAVDSQIFAKTAIGDLVEQRLKLDTLMGLDNTVSGTEVRDYIVQYRESNLNFVSRLMEHAGIYYYFTHEDGAHKMVLLDNVGKHQPTPGLSQLTFTSESLDEASLTGLDLVSEVHSGAYATGDYNYVTPNMQIAAANASPKAHDNAGFEVYDHPISSTTNSFATTYAKIRGEELATRYSLAHGQATERLLQVGFKVTVANHPVAALNQEYLVVGHSFAAVNNLAQSAAGSGGQFNCEFEAIPADVQFRSLRLAQKPVIPGTQTALVVSDFHNDTDSSGGTDPVGANMARVKIEFYWDRYGRQSCWARVSQPWAGKGYGFQNMPRVGEEVLVQFIEGDPDRPVVIGRVYNAENMPPFKLPANASITGLKTLSIDGQGNSVAGKWNELRFDDRDGAEQIYVQAQKDYDRRVLNDSKTWVGNESHAYVAKDAFQKFDHDLHVVTTGDHNNKVGGSLSFKVTQDTHLKADGKVLIKAGPEFTVESDGNVVLSAASGMTIKCGSSFITLKPDGIYIVGPKVNVNSGGSQVSPNHAAPVAANDAKVAMTSDGGSKTQAPPAPSPPTAFSPQASSFKVAALTGAPFVAPCTDC